MDREQCTRCAIKHLAQARVLMNEARNGYPVHVWYAMGHLAEAEDEIIGIQPMDAVAIRAERIKIQDALEADETYVPDFEALMLRVGEGGLLPETQYGETE